MRNIVLLVVASIGCGASTKPPPGSKCVMNSDCNAPLVCSDGRCHVACRETRDCQTGSQCVKNQTNELVCQLTDEVKCTLASQCAAPLVCALDLQCRNQCAQDRDCGKGQHCIELVCVEPEDYDPTSGRLRRAPAFSEALDGGAPDTSAATEAGPADAGPPDLTPDLAPDLAPDLGPDLPPPCKEKNGALRFSGGQHVRIPDSAGLRFTDMTIELWARFTSAAATHCLICKPASGNARSFRLWYSEGRLMGLEGGVTWAPEIGRWYHLAWSYDWATRLQRLYVDGVEVFMGPTTTVPEWNGNDVTLGAHIYYGVFYSGFVGDLDEVRLWRTVRTAEQVRADRQLCSAGPMPGLAAYWSLDEGTGQPVPDGSGNNQTGFLGPTSGPEAGDPSWIQSTVPFR